MSAGRIEPLGDCALLIHFGTGIDPAVNALALTAAHALLAADLPGLRDIAPAYASVCLQYDPCAWADPAGVQSPHARIAARISGIVENLQTPRSNPDVATIDIPVCYGGDFGPDLGEVARHANMSVDEVVERHCAGEYRVAMLGFAPGFPYLIGLDAALCTPRLPSPRLRVPAGSVAIGGKQTGVYPRELPGGWRLIGRTPLRLFDPVREPPALFAPGGRVRFRAIAADAFAAAPA
ncbi:MAG: 5-oxoprolinase subunit PxpB [Rudaea sp.]|nr:5-oxoprolinase subunit PxpB [Rudaea sp.]